MSEIERRLQGALMPIEPPGELSMRLERRLSAVTDAAVDELAEWDPSALRDPRRWARLVAAGVVGASAGGALVLVRARQNAKRRDARGFAALQKGMRSVVGDARRRLDRR